MNLELRCGLCGHFTDAMAPTGWRCSCGGAWELPEGPPFDPDAVDRRAPGLWRYAAQLRLPSDRGISLGEGACPRLRLRDGPLVACAYRQPTPSFKALGVATLVTWARLAATPPLIEDSSGNAGAALAAYAAAAGLRCRVYVPASAPAGKRRLLEAHGAEVVVVRGPRARATEAALADTDGTYCSHAWNPFFLEGVKTLAFTLWESLGDRLPERIYVPAGQGSLVLGLWHGFTEIAGGVTGFRPPAIVAVQHRDIAPLLAVPSRSTEPAVAPLADGIAIPRPARRGPVLEAVGASRGEVRVVGDDEIRAALDTLAAHGLWVEPTAAVGLAGQRQVGDDERALAVLTGHGRNAEGGRRAAPATEVR